MEREKIKHLPVLNKQGELVGIVTAANLLRKVAHVVLIDPLTRVYNRRYLDIISYKIKDRHNYSLLMLDIDDFKKINDGYGHDFGDKVLTDLGQVLLKCIRNYDDVVRYGGEEFLVVLYRAGIKEALTVAERIRQKFWETKYDEVPGLRVSVSIGVAEGTGTENLWETIKRADTALYEAKRKGKNRVEVSVNSEQ